MDNYIVADIVSADRSFKLRRLFVLMVLLMAVLSLIPFSADDVDFMSGGLEGITYPANILGRFGTCVGWSLLVTLGLSAYLSLGLALICSLRRLVWRGGLRRASWEYAGSLAIFALGTAMMLSLRPDSFLPLTSRLNIQSLPGGVLGWRLCAPRTGWLYFLLNQIGCYVISSIMIITSLCVIWYYDWHALFLSRLNSQTNDQGDNYPQPYERATQTQLSVVSNMPSARPRPQVVQQTPSKVTAHPGLPENFDPGEEAQLDLPLPPVPAASPQKAPAAKPSPASQITQGKSVLPPVGAEYTLPSIDLLNRSQNADNIGHYQEVEDKKRTLQATLDSFDFDAEVENAIVGPQVTRFEIATAPGVNISRLGSIQNNISMNLRVQGENGVRLLLPIPGKDLVGIEVPNLNPSVVCGYELFDDDAWKHSKMNIPLVLGKNISNKTVVIDLAKAPHLLIAGSTGSGKSVCMNLLITSMLYKFSPDELKLVMVDPKSVEFLPYEALPHLIVPIITEVEKTHLALKYAINEMKRRYDLLILAKVRNINEFNHRPPRDPNAPPLLDKNGDPVPDRLPFIVVIIDELADVMTCAGKDVEHCLQRLTALSRAAGIHTIIATQRPDTKVITGTIKNNYPVRIAFKVPSQTDSRTILDVKGAESLVGRGDMLYKGLNGMERIQCGFVDTPEVERIVEYVSAQAEQHFDEGVVQALEASEDDDEAAGGSQIPISNENLSKDEQLYRQAVELVIRTRKPTISYVQRMLKIGYNKSADLIDRMEDEGIVSAPSGSGQQRELLVNSLAEVGMFQGDSAAELEADSFGDDE
jgi:S-DNA-T family DNA segregation ATPase FtsK/SpoIIIE